MPFSPELKRRSSSASPAASAIEFKDLGGLPLTVDVTNTAIASYRFDNRNDFFDGQRKPDPRVKVDDNYFDDNHFDHLHQHDVHDGPGDEQHGTATGR